MGIQHVEDCAYCLRIPNVQTRVFGDREEITMLADTAILSLENPVFQTYVLPSSIMILKLMLQPWDDGGTDDEGRGRISQS